MWSGNSSIYCPITKFQEVLVYVTISHKFFPDIHKAFPSLVNDSHPKWQARKLIDTLLSVQKNVGSFNASYEDLNSSIAEANSGNSGKVDESPRNYAEVCAWVHVAPKCGPDLPQFVWVGFTWNTHATAGRIHFSARWCTNHVTQLQSNGRRLFKGRRLPIAGLTRKEKISGRSSLFQSRRRLLKEGRTFLRWT